MNILVIKQTSLGDVLHASGHIRALKKAFPHSKLFVLTATTSQDIFRHNPWVDELIAVDGYRIKSNWYKNPLWAWREMSRVCKAVRKQPFELAFDLQGLAKSVLFLYAACARRKYVKGNWPGLQGYRNKSDHALDEMSGVLQLAGVDVSDVGMEFVTGAHASRQVDAFLQATNPQRQPLVLMSPYSRWQSKDWPLAKFIHLARTLEERFVGELKILFTGAPEKQSEVETAIANSGLHATESVIAKLSMLEFVELVSRAKMMITGDSFPMHVAVAKGTPVIALFGPTDERKVGPTSRGRERHQVIRAPDCTMCYQKNCVRECLAKIPVDEVADAAARFM